MTTPRNSPTMFETYRHQVYGWAYRVLRNHEDALDVTQEVFVKWWQAQRRGDEVEHPLGWLRRVTINRSIDAVRREKTSGADSASVPDRASCPSDPVEQRETTALVVEALRALSTQQRAVLVAKVYDGCTFAEIAGQMNLAVPTVKTHYLRALQGVRSKLTEAAVVGGAVESRICGREVTHEL